MGKNLPPRDTADEAAGAQQNTIIRAQPGQPWPEPPNSGTWSRNPDTGDLTLVTPPPAAQTEAQRRARREAQRTEALAQQAKQEAKE